MYMCICVYTHTSKLLLAEDIIQLCCFFLFLERKNNNVAQLGFSGVPRAEAHTRPCLDVNPAPSPAEV